MPIVKRNNHTTQQSESKRKPSGNVEDIARYNSTTWRALREKVLRREPLCRECSKRGRIVTASVVDHIERARENPARFYDESNLQPLCKHCHDKKSQSERNQNKQTK